MEIPAIRHRHNAPNYVFGFAVRTRALPRILWRKICRNGQD